jgi:hypothetical protein
MSRMIYSQYDLAATLLGADNLGLDVGPFHTTGVPVHLPKQTFDVENRASIVTLFRR